MPNLTEQLKRDGNLLTRSKPKGKAPRRRIPRVTKKRAKQNREYAARRKAYLLAHPYCMARDKIMDYLREENDLAAYMAAPRGGIWFSEEVHHTKKPKCKYLNDESTWLAVCSWSHRFIEQNKSVARTLGLLSY